MMTLMLSIMLILCSWLGIAFYLDRYGQRPLSPGEYDAALVPGCAVRPDGTASGALARRTQHAIELWRNGTVKTIILTGGVGTYPPSEAAAAAKIAVEAGIPNSALIREETSTTTAENAEFSVAMRPGMADWSIVVTSDGYHCWRCKRLFAKHYATVQTAGSTPNRRLRIRGALREVFSIIKMMVTLN